MARPDWLYLASQSPRRAQLLDQLGVVHRPLLPAPDEDAEALEAERRGESPAAYVQRVTAAKLDAARRRLKALGLPAAPILCADTTVAIGRRILAKPVDAAHACAMLAELAGREHRVLTAVVVGTARRSEAALQVSRVRFEPLTARQIRAYVDTGEPMGKAGAYGIQGRAGAWASMVYGSHSGIMGLPLHETAVLLRRHGWLL
jgi:septum formation protein